MSPVSEFNAYNGGSAVLLAACPGCRGRRDTRSRTNMVVSGVCGELYYAVLPDGTYFYIPQSAVAQCLRLPEPTH